MFPGWGRLLARVGYPRRLLGRLDALAHDRPGIADFVVSIWRPRPRAEWPTEAYRVRESNPVYQQMRGAEARYWETANFDAFFAPTNQATAAARNRDYTGNPERTWMDDLVARGPFRDVAVLGCDDEDYAGAWLRAGGSERLTVYELSPGVIAKARDRLGPLAVRVGFVSTDLNFVELPAGAYDCIWSSGVLHFVTNLEHLFAQVDRALRPGGVFAFQCYVGEPRLQYAPARLAKMNAVLETVPARYRRKDRIVPPEAPWHLSPFQAVRPRDIVPLASARFEPVHLGFGGRFFPLALMLDMPALVREAPEVVARLEQADAAAASDLDMQPTAVYAVFRKRG
jgi:SAM-dependent methyltransferase